MVENLPSQVQRGQRHDIGSQECQASSAIRLGITGRQRNQRRFAFHPDGSHAWNTCRQAQQRRPGPAAAFQHMLSATRRDGGSQQHRLDAAAETGPWLRVVNLAAEQVPVRRARRDSRG